MWVVARTEFRRLMRSGKLLVLIALTLLLGLMATIGTVWWWATDLSREATVEWDTGAVVVAERALGFRLTWATVVLLLPVCFVAMPVLTADMVAGEREDGTLEMLELTALRPRELVLGKFFAAAAATALVALSTLPFLLIADLAGGPSLLGTFAFVGAAALYCLPFAAVGIGRSVRSATRAEAMRSAFRDMLLWPAVGLAIACGGGTFAYVLRSVLQGFMTGSRIGFWTTHILTFPAGFMWTDVFNRLGKTPWFWLAVPVALTIHCLRRAWVTAAWLEPTRVAEQTQARRRGHADREAALAAAARGTATAVALPPPPFGGPVSEERTRWGMVSQRIRNPIEILATLRKRDAAWYFALLGWIIPLMVVGLPIAVEPNLAKERSIFPSLAAMFWIGVLLAYVCMVTPTIVTSEREGGTLDSLRMTRLGPPDLIWGKLKARFIELGLLVVGGGLFLSIFFIWGALSLPSLLLLWVSGPIYAAAYAGFGAAASVMCRRSTHSILAGWGLLFVPVMLSLAMVNIAGVIGRWGLLPLSPPLVVFRCLVFTLPDPVGPSLWLPHLQAYTVWGLSLVAYLALAVVTWWIALRQFDRFLFENRDRGS
jgi:ABC-type transport system involved in multi-copper enzyme maturation permease subunit